MSAYDNHSLQQDHPSQAVYGTSERVYYQLSQESWPEEGICLVVDRDGEQLLDFSVSFLRIGLVHNIGFILEQIASAYVVPSGFWLSNEKNEKTHESDLVTAGTYQLHGADDVRPRIGPRFKFRHRPPNVSDDYASTMSNSKRSTANQAAFRMDVVARDTFCLISDANHKTCTACHILPQSRPEYYREILGRNPGYLFQPSFGLLLRDDLHHGFDRGSIALYPSTLEDGSMSLIVHIVKLDDEKWRQYHGKVIKCDTRFRCEPRDYPNFDFLRFHYKQCCIKYFRGWSHF